MKTNLKLGDKVIWTDPDSGYSSGFYIIYKIEGDVYSIKNEFTEAEAFENELSLLGSVEM